MADLRPGIKIGMGLGNVADATLRLYRQIGVEAVRIPTRTNTRLTVRPLVPPAQRGPRGRQGLPWDEALLRRIMARVEAYGLAPLGANLEPSGRILMGQPGRDEDIESCIACIESAGRLGLQVLTYNFTALRASEGYGARPGAGRGGADLRDFDYARIRDLPPLESVGVHTLDEMWARLAYFIRAVIPVAERAGVRLAVHPNDPPVPAYRGVAQPLGDMEGLLRLLDLVDSPSNTLFFDTGVTTEMGYDAPEMIRRIGGRDRIGTVHFRNVRVETPRYKYLETFHDEGEADLLACMQAFHDVGYDGMLDPDHTPGLTDDTADTRIGWTLAIGGMIALRNAVRSGAS
ncbi:MAG: mannonate dehydratase [Anaerolineae bacterium]|nr:mannonate dehydratase [Anaerolineae bacterium]